jgi:hypothetical protein
MAVIVGLPLGLRTDSGERDRCGSDLLGYRSALAGPYPEVKHSMQGRMEPQYSIQCFHGRGGCIFEG